MKTYALPLFPVLIFAALLVSCATSSHKLQSVSITPASADAQSYPNGQVQFTAIGYYNSRPSPVKPLTATWGACFQDATTTEVTVSATGLAQCGPGAAGAFTVWAYGTKPGMGNLRRHQRLRRWMRSHHRHSSIDVPLSAGQEIAGRTRVLFHLPRWEDGFRPTSRRCTTLPFHC